MKRVPIEAALDLHAFAPRDIPSVVDEYVTAAWHGGLREVRLLRAQHVTLASPHPVRAHIDGELISTERFDIRIVPGALMVMGEA